MPVSPTYPGVYIEEVPSGVRTISGVSTSVGLFIGRTVAGPMNQPKRCLNYSDFERIFTTDARFSEMPRAVKLFFDNGGTDCWVMRIATGSVAASVTLRNEAGSGDALRLTAKSDGKVGDQIRVEVSYAGPTPEATFSMTIYRLVADGSGQLQRADVEQFINLSMNPNSRRYAPLVITQGSKLVKADAGGASAAANGGSKAGRPIETGVWPAPWNDITAAVPNTAATEAGSKFLMSVDGNAFAPVDISGVAPGADVNELATNLAARINPQLPGGTTISVSVENAVGTTLKTLRFASTNGDVLIQSSPDSSRDLARRFMLGTDNGGIEQSKWATARPAPTGAVLLVDKLNLFADVTQSTLATITIDGVAVTVPLVTDATVGSKMYQDGLGAAGAITGNNDGVREKLRIIASAVNAAAAGNPTLTWRAEVWGSRLALVPAGGNDNATATVSSAANTFFDSSAGAAVPSGSDTINANVRRYTLGPNVLGAYEVAGPASSDGATPTLPTYTAAFQVVAKEVDLFNLMVLPKDFDQNAIDRSILWGPASVFCQQRRAFLLIDPPDGWVDKDAAAAGINSLRAGTVKTHSAVFFPLVRMIDGTLTVDVSPAGAVAGLMARTDATRGVWKAPAGSDADIRSIVGLSQRLSNEENGILNPRGINTLRVFPVGIVNWGARTLDGDDDFGSEWKYVPVRRLALYLEESLYRGTNWVVFEPNDEPLWAQIRLNVGAFMHTLFRQGAFQGKTPRDAYFVKCDKETTTQDDINRGIVNILVGFAPLKPAEFVIIKLQQIAGQLAA